MAILSKGTDFTTGDQVTAAKLDALVDNATFASDAVDDSTTALDTNGKIIVKDGGITAAKLNVTNLQTATSNTGVVVLKAIDGANVELYGGSHASNASLMVLDANEVRIRSQDGSTSKMHIDSSGNVGIGTTSPSQELHVVGTSGDIGIKVEHTGTGTSDDTRLDFKVNNDDARTFIRFGDTASNESGIITYDHSVDAMKFNVNAGERMRVHSTGHVTVGRSTIGSSSNSDGIVLRNDGEIYLARDGTSSQNHILFINNAASSAATVGSVSTSGSATAFNTSSDYRLKEDVIDMQDSISKVQLLKPVNFAWKLDGTRADGFLAHEAQEVVPAAVTGTKDAVDEDGQPDYQGIDQSKLVPLLTKALQEALTKIESLEARVAALES